MRGFQCHFYGKVKGKLVKNSNTACWGGVRYYSQAKEDNCPDYIKPYKLDEDKIYIEDYNYKDTEKYQELLINNINKITPCKFVEIDNKKLIYFELLETYDQNLVVLNFIRNLWNDPIKGYCSKFFKALEDSDDPDALINLTYANKVACKDTVKYSLGHSNCHISDKLILKSTEELKDYKGTSTQTFLTT